MMNMIERIKYTLKTIVAVIGMAFSVALRDNYEFASAIIFALCFYILIDVSSKLDRAIAVGIKLSKPVTIVNMYYKRNRG